MLSAQTAALAATYAIPPPQLDPSKVYRGQASAFDKPAEVQFETIVQETPEFKEMKKKKIEQGSGKYWLLLSQASDRAIRAISDSAKDMDHDFIAAKGYLGTLNPAIPATDVTDVVIAKMLGKRIPKSKAVKPKKSSAPPKAEAKKPEPATAEKTSTPALPETTTAASATSTANAQAPEATTAATEKQEVKRAFFWGREKKETDAPQNTAPPAGTASPGASSAPASSSTTNG